MISKTHESNRRESIECLSCSNFNALEEQNSQWCYWRVLYLDGYSLSTKHQHICYKMLWIVLCRKWHNLFINFYLSQRERRYCWQFFLEEVKVNTSHLHSTCRLIDTRLNFCFDIRQTFWCWQLSMFIS